MSNPPWRRAAILLLAGLLLALPTNTAQGPAQNDAGSGADAGDDRNGATRLANPARYTGQLVAGSDDHDWYKFNVASVTGSTGRPVLELFLFAREAQNVRLQLFSPSATAQPTVEGAGPAGAKVVRHSLDADSDWAVHVFGSGVTAEYELTLSLLIEDDASFKRDARDTTAANGLLVPGLMPGKAVVVQGTLNRPDTGDVYRFSVPTADARVLVALHHPRTSSMELSLLHPGAASSAATDTVRSAEGFATVHSEGGESGTWGVRVAASATAPERSFGPYRLMVLVDPPGAEERDLASGDDAPEGLDGAMTLPAGFHVASLSGASPADTTDAFKLANVGAGQTLRVAASTHTRDLQRPQLVLTLHRPDRTEVARRTLCDASAGITWTAPEAGTWYVKVMEAAAVSGACPAAPPAALRGGAYSIFFGADGQSDPPAGGDAPHDFPLVSTTLGTSVGTAWLDRSDVTDVYGLGNVGEGQAIRAVISTNSPQLELEARVLDVDGVAVGNVARPTDGAIRIELIAVDSSRYFLEVRQDLQAAAPDTEGPYRFYAGVAEDEPPSAVVLATPLPTDVRRTTIHLSWSQSTDDDFRRYEVHRSQVADFVPSGSTLAATIDQRQTTETDITGLQSGQRYTFLVRVVDNAGFVADSNRVTVTMQSGVVGNNAPTLTEGRVEPTSGNPSTLFTYHVKYTDADDDAPVVRRVYIDGAPNAMQTTDSDFDDGASYTFSTTLSAGVHSFFFEFNDGDATVRDPVQGARSGPEVSTAQNRPPTVDASASPTEGEAPLKVRFGADARDSDGDSLSYSWDFDNSNGFQAESNREDPEHTYTEPGIYTATVRVRDAPGATSTDSVTVNVRSTSNQPPTVSPTAQPASGAPPLAVTFDAGAEDPDGTIARYEWDFDNSDGIKAESTQASPSHTYDRAGSFTATVTVEDNRGLEATGSVTVLVRTSGNEPPSVVVAANPPQGPAPLTVTFTAQTNDPEGGNVDVVWDFDSSNGVTIEARGPTATHTYDQPGLYTVIAIGRDADGSQATGTVRVAVLRPDQQEEALLVIEAEPRSGKPPLSVHFRANTSRLPTTPATYLWDFGDGTPNTTEVEPNHTYEGTGSFTAKVTVTDDSGTAFEATVVIQVAKKTPGLDAAGLWVATLGAALLWHRRRGR